MCIPVIDTDCNPLGDLAAGTAKRFLDELAQQTTEAAAEMLRVVVAGWISIPSPTVSEESGAVAYLRAYTNWAVAAIAVGAVLVAAIRLAWERNGREAGSFARGLVMLVILTGAGVPAVQLLIEIGDAYSTWILDQAADGDLGKRLLLFAPSGGALGGMTPLIVLGISSMLFLVTIVQLLMLIARGAGLVLLSGLLPLAGAAGIAGGGRGMRDRYLTWLLAMLLYKPAAATIYAAAFWMLGHGQDLTTLLSGVVMFCMAIVALPALMRLIAPAVSTLSFGGGSSVIGAAAVSGGTQLASGAVRLSSAGGGGSGGGRTGGGPGPTGTAPGGSAATPAARGAFGAGGSGAGAAGGGSAAAGAGTAGAGAAGAGAAAAGPAGVAVAAGMAVTKAGPAAVRKVGGTASGAIGGEG